jgi:hypothetical protein
MKTVRILISAIALAACSLSALASSAVSAGGSGAVGTLTDLGSFAAGTYTITGSGTVGLTPDGGFIMNPDGTPNQPVTAAGYGYFNPNGSTVDNYQPGVFGAAGSTVNLGALIGSFSAAPSTPSDWFLIGYSKTVTLASAGHIYASVNDTFHQNNTGAFSASVTAVPEPESYAMLLAGLGLMGAIARRRNNKKA